jgi:alpha-amylase
MRQVSVLSLHRRALTGVIAAVLVAGCASGPPPPPIPFDQRPVPQADPGSPLPAGWQHGAFMEVFVRGYHDSDGDGIGDLRGLTQKLDYLQWLGVRGLWLMPITRSADRDHGYAVTDFRDIDPAYGTLADFDELLRQAHARGIGVIMDYVFNHASHRHPAFERATRSADDPLRHWFVWQQPAPAGWDIWGNNPWYRGADGSGARFFSTFGPHMPDFNLRQPEVLAWHHDNLRFWLNRGLDGFRFDAVPHLVENDAVRWNDQPESYALMRGIRSLVAAYDKRYLVCEATASPLRWGSDEGCGSAFAFQLEHQILKAAQGEPGAVKAVADYFRTAPASMATMLANHDIFAGRRVWDQLGGDLAAYRLAAAIYLLLPGTPFIYYGEEIGMAGVGRLRGDPQLRTPMSWTADGSGFSRARPFRPLSDNAAQQNVAAQRDDPQSLLHHYRGLLALRNRLPSIAQGRYEAATADGSAFSFQRRLGDERALVVVNAGREARAWTAQALPSGAVLTPVWPPAVADGATQASTTAPARATTGATPPGAEPMATARSRRPRADTEGRAALQLPAQSVLVYTVSEPR